MAIQKDIIKQLPLFMGLGEKELAEIAEFKPFALHHHKKGAVIKEAETISDELVIITKGDFEIETKSDDNSYRLTEMMHNVHIIEPDKLFGLVQRYRSTYKAQGPCETVVISKECLHELIDTFLVVRLNFMNIVCRKAQLLEHSPWKACSSDLCQRIVKFVRDRARHPAGSKTIHITMKTLAEELGCSRLDVSIALNKLADNERIILTRGIIEIPALQLL